MRVTYRHRLQPPEYAFLTISTVGTIAAAVTQQVVYATVPLTLAMSLILTKRQQFPQPTQQQTIEESADVRQIKQDVDIITQELNTLYLRFNTRPESQQIDSLKEVIAQLPLQTKPFDPTSLTLQITELQQSVANFESSSIFDKMVQIQTTLQLLQENIDRQRQQDEILRKVIEELQLRFQIVSYLSSKISNLNQQQQWCENQINKIQSQLQDIDIKAADQHKDTQQIEQNLEKLQQQVFRCNQSPNKLNSEGTFQAPFDSFETLILKCLQEGLSHQEIIPQYDAGTGSDYSKSIDFVVAMRNCIIAIEAKCYKGVIQPIGDSRNTHWTCKTRTGNLIVNSCWGVNHYQQIRTYVDSIRKRTQKHVDSPNPNIRLTLPVYGIVVFPNEAEIALSIRSSNKKFYRITTLNNLLEVINALETQARFSNQSRLSYKNILEILTGTSKRNAA